MLSRLTNIVFFSSRRRHTRFDCDWSSDVCSSDLAFRSYDYDDPRPEPAVERVTMPPGPKADPAKGRALFPHRAKGPGSGCHLAPGAAVGPAGHGGPALPPPRDPGRPHPYPYQPLSNPH